tara:strand:- start:1242 stop:2021 length:780 start_codon:yes stop_codon:yes gene_type:complete
MKNTITHIAIIALLSVFTGCNNTKKDQIATPVIPEANSVEVTSKAIVQYDYVYINAPSGLSLREDNNLDSKKITVMPYGTKVKLISVEENETMTVAGIKGGMNQVEYNDKTGYAFNGYLSSFFPPEKHIWLKQYIEDLKVSFPTASYSYTDSGTNNEYDDGIVTISLPTAKWHEGFIIGQHLFDIPTSFAFPSQEGSDSQTIENSHKSHEMYSSYLWISRTKNALKRIYYEQSGEGYGKFVTISKEGDMMEISYWQTVD